jgi:hypothetical protein
MPVDTQNTDYAKNIAVWELVRDCDEGATAIKNRPNKYSLFAGGIGSVRGTAYLPAPNARDGSEENQVRYDAYRSRANFVNFVSHTKEGMLGMVFRKPTEIELPLSIDYITEDANGNGLHLDQMIKDAASDTLLTGRYCLLVDYPQTEEGLTQAQVSNAGLKASLLAYPAESVINWRCEVVNGVKQLTMVVLQEPRIEPLDNDPFEVEHCMYHRVLFLDEGVYTQHLYDENNKLVSDDIIPRKSNGSTWDVIPFEFIGSINNDETADKAPLYDIAEVNVAHYRNSADYEESSFIVGQPTPVIAGLTQQWADDNFSGGIELGSRSGLLLPIDSNASLLQALPNQMPERGMELKEDQMVKIGTRIIQDSTGSETAEAAKIRFAGQNSKLGSLIVNVEAGFVKALKWLAEFMGGEGEVTLNINKEFYDATIDPQMLAQAMVLQDRGVIGKTDLRYLLRRSNLLDDERTDEEIDNDAEVVEVEPVVIQEIPEETPEEEVGNQ